MTREAELRKEIEELKRTIPKIDVFKKDSSIIASDYYNWKDVYSAIDKAVELCITETNAKWKQALQELKDKYWKLMTKEQFFNLVNEVFGELTQ